MIGPVNSSIKDASSSSNEDDGCYLHQWTAIQAGPDFAQWTFLPGLAMEFCSFEWAFAIAPLYNCKVYSRKGDNIAFRSE